MPAPHQLVFREPRHAQPQVDPVEQRTGELLPVLVHTIGPAAAVATRIALEPARARIRGSDQGEPSRELDRAHRPGHDDAAILERLPQSLDRVATELGELVEEQHAVMCERYLAGPKVRCASSEQAGGRDGMVRRPERTRPQHASSGQEPGDRMQLGRLERLFPGQARQDRGHAPREHRLAGTRRTDHQHVMAARRCDLEGAAGLCLTPHVDEIDAARSVALERGLVDGRGLPSAAEETDHLGEGRGRDDLQPVDLRRFERVDSRHHDAIEAGLRRRDRDGEDAGGRHQLPFERELSGEREPGQLRRGHLRRGSEHTHRDRQVEPGPLLPEVAWREVDHDPSQRPLEPLALDRRADAFAGVAHGCAGQPRERERGQPTADVGLDGDEVTAHPEHRHAQDPSVHAADAMRRPEPVP